jgi:hypothetical protein
MCVLRSTPRSEGLGNPSGFAGLVRDIELDVLLGVEIPPGERGQHQRPARPNGIQQAIDHRVGSPLDVAERAQRGMDQDCIPCPDTHGQNAVTDLLPGYRRYRLRHLYNSLLAKIRF